MAFEHLLSLEARKLQAGFYRRERELVHTEHEWSTPQWLAVTLIEIHDST